MKFLIQPQRHIWHYKQFCISAYESIKVMLVSHTTVPVKRIVRVTVRERQIFLKYPGYPVWLVWAALIYEQRKKSAWKRRETANVSLLHRKAVLLTYGGYNPSGGIWVTVMNINAFRNNKNILSGNAWNMFITWQWLKIQIDVASSAFFVNFWNDSKKLYQVSISCHIQ